MTIETIKAYTDLFQSKVLSKILPPESADMEFMFLKKDNSMVSRVPFIKEGHEEPDCPYNMVPCWSLTALLSVLEHPRCFQGDKPIYWFCGCFDKDDLYHEVEADNPVDACYKMILELYKLGLWKRN